MNTKSLLSTKDRPIKSILIYAAVITLYSNIGVCAAASFQSVTTGQENEQVDRNGKARSEPMSILFPSGIPGPYFPDGEVARAAQEAMSLEENNNNDSDNMTNNENLVVENGSVIEIDELAAPDKNAFGILLPAGEGFSKNIWRRSTYEKIEQLLAALHLPSTSPAMDDISKKLLLSRATAPTGFTGPDIDGSTGLAVETPEEEFDEALSKKFLNLRIAELTERGNLTDLMAFIQNIPRDTLAVNKSNAEILMLGGNLIGACQMTREARSPDDETIGNDNVSSEDNLFWMKMLTFCRVLEENNSGAQIALDMLNEQGSVDFIFFDLINLLMLDPASRTTFLTSGLTSLDPLNYTILSLLDQPIEAELIENSSALILSALVINPNMTKENRFQAAIKSYKSGGVSVDVLRDIYDLQEFSTIEYENAVRFSENDERDSADVLLYQAASKQISDQNKATVLNAIWTKAILDNDLPRKSKLNVDTLMSLNPNISLINHAHSITRGLILAGELDKAKQWYNFVRQNAVGGDAEATRALINIWPLIILASEKGEIPWNNDILELWWNGQMVLSPENRESKAALFYAIAEAFQYEVSEEKWDELITENSMDNTRAIPLGVWREMIKSVGERKAAQSVILSLIAMGPQGPGSLDASGLSAVIRALRSFGLGQEARSIALEALVANDF